MDKQKQIEEMAKVLSTVKRCDALALSECIKKKCEYPHYEGVTCIAEHQAETLFNAGYRTIPEGAVVLTREEYESVKDSVDLLREYESVSNSLIKSNELCRKLVEDKKELKWQLKQTRKETAEKFAERLKAESDDGVIHLTLYEIDEICKEISEGK